MAERKPLISGNWKMHMNHLEAIQLIHKLSYALDHADYASADVSIHPPFTKSPMANGLAGTGMPGRISAISSRSAAQSDAASSATELMRAAIGAQPLRPIPRRQESRPPVLEARQGPHHGWAGRDSLQRCLLARPPYGATCSPDGRSAIPHLHGSLPLTDCRNTPKT